jgi:prevent-host-death family protein
MTDACPDDDDERHVERLLTRPHHGHNVLTMLPARPKNSKPSTTQPVPAGQFKAQCLELLDRVARDGESYVVTKYGKPVAKVVPVDAPEPRSLRGSVTFMGDIVAPLGVDFTADDDDRP